jgi:hypothetical protein
LSRAHADALADDNEILPWLTACAGVRFEIWTA